MGNFRMISDNPLHLLHVFVPNKCVPLLMWVLTFRHPKRRSHFLLHFHCVPSSDDYAAHAVLAFAKTLNSFHHKSHFWSFVCWPWFVYFVITYPMDASNPQYLKWCQKKWICSYQIKRKIITVFLNFTMWTIYMWCTLFGGFYVWSALHTTTEQ